MFPFNPLDSLTLDKKPKEQLSKRQRERLRRSLKGYLVAMYSKKGYTYLWYSRAPERLHKYLSEREGEPLEIINIIPSNNTRLDIARLYKVFENKADSVSFWFKLDESDLDAIRMIEGA